MEEKKTKHCPFIGEYCIKERCTLWAEMKKQQDGVMQKFGTCIFTSLAIILSEINTKTEAPPNQKKIVIPNNINIRGN